MKSQSQQYREHIYRRELNFQEIAIESTINRCSFCRVQRQDEKRWNYFADSHSLYGESDSKKGIIHYKSLEVYIFG
jgi:hypothetical protein